MKPNHKLKLWQKIKQLLSTSAPLPSADATILQEDAKQKTDSKTEVHKDTDSTVSINNNLDKDHIAKHATHDGQGSNAKILITENSVNNNKDAHKNNDVTPIVDYLKKYFHDKQWHYNYYPPRTHDSQQSHHLSLRMINKQLECGYLFRIQESNALLAVYGILPFLIPESHQSSAMLLITQINYDMLIGNIEMDVNDGEIRYKNAIDIEAVGINDDITEHLLQSVIAMTTFAYEIFSDLVNTQDPAEDMSTLLVELRQQADERTFFLPTQLVQ